MQTAIDLFHYIQERLGVSAVTIALIVILGLCFGLPAGRVVRAAFAAGVGFVGLGLLLGALENALVPAVQAIAENSGLSPGVVDVGEAPFAALVSASEIGALILPIGIAVNLLMLATNTTRTINIDFPGYRYFAYTGVMVQRASGSLPLGLAAAALNTVIVTVIADKAAPGLKKSTGLRGVSMPHGFAAAFVPVAFVANRFVEYLPGLNRPKADMDRIRERLGVLGEPAPLGFALGFVIALAAGLGAAPVPDLIADALTAAVQTAAAFALAPKLLSFLMEGIHPLADAAGDFMRKHCKNRSAVYIGPDAVCWLGHPLVLTCTPILTLLSVFLAVILPGNRMLPFAGLAFIPYILAAVLPITGGAFFRSLLVGALTTAFMLYCGSGMAALFMNAVTDAGLEAYVNQTADFVSIQGANPLTWAVAALGGLQRLGIAILTVIAAGLALQNRRSILKAAKNPAGRRASAEEAPSESGEPS
ncbi:MAG: PTS sugar transporter subunit IIC [Clostridiales Family XIII bacterium]|jgi:PTS system galactitol-specific IIC component|nr:PTS sugar transporter subunit IIC [Clostridiales Family XIII bacterium]